MADSATAAKMIVENQATLGHFIGGAHVTSASSRFASVFNPATGQQTKRVGLGTKSEVESAIENARQAFPAWRELPPLKRARIMFRYKELLEQNADRIAKVFSDEHGKVIDDAMGEFRRGVEVVEYVDVGEDALGDGNVTVAVEYSTVYYKDGLAITNASPIVRKKPLILGIDYAGTVLESTSDRFSVGDKVVRNGFGASELLNGGYCQRARASDQHLVGLPDGISTRQAMAIGTAGYTSMLCVLALEDGGVSPSQGEVLVTGAAGGVGTVAVAILSKLGYTVVASTGRPQEADFLKDLGASSIIDRQELSEKGGPMQRERWAGVVDCVGSHTLANALATTKYGGVVAACGLAQGVDLPATVLRFILRGVQLQGIDSVQAPLAKRERAWARLATDLDLKKLEKLSFDVAFSDVKQVALDVLAGRTRGRAIVEIAS